MSLRDSYGREIRSLTADEQVRFIRHAQEGHPLPFMWSMMFLDLGPRNSELRLVTMGDVRRAFDMPTPALRLLTLKRRKETYRLVPIPTVSHTPCKDINLQDLLKAEMSDRKNEPDEFYFVRTFDNRKKSMYRRDPASQIIFKWHITPMLQAVGLHDVAMKEFRHTFAINLLKKNIPLPIIQKMLGHANMGNTGIYLAPSTEDAFTEVLKESINGKED